VRGTYDVNADCTYTSIAENGVTFRSVIVIIPPGWCHGTPGALLRDSDCSSIFCPRTIGCSSGWPSFGACRPRSLADDLEHEVVEPERSRQRRPVVDHRGCGAIRKQPRPVRRERREFVEIDGSESGEWIEGIVECSSTDTGVNRDRGRESGIDAEVDGLPGGLVRQEVGGSSRGVGLQAQCRVDRVPGGSPID
jgi:hypothetical protein